MDQFGINQKKQNLIDTILRGWKLPKFYFVKDQGSTDEFDVVDGQQRLTAIFEFFNNELALSSDSSKRFGAEFYRDLSEVLSDKFDDFEIEYDEIEDATDEELKLFFQKLQEGLPLTTGEKLNSLHSLLRDFARELAEHPFFENKVSISNTRFAYFDIATKFIAIEIEGINTGLRFDEIKKLFEENKNFSKLSSAAQKIVGTFNYLDKVFTERSPLLKNRTIIQSFATLTSRIIGGGHSEGYETNLLAFFENFLKELSAQVELGGNATDNDYILFQRSINANVKAAASLRQSILLRKLFAYNPESMDLFDSTIILESGMDLRIKQIAENIVKLVTDINDLYASTHGGDLFKPTNKTIQTNARLGKVIRTHNDYKTFVEDLYFLFHEGIGNRLDGKKPNTFSEVNDLRTDQEHDLDHGSPSKVRAKRRKTGSTFQKYSGGSSPATLAPERFRTLQVNLLSALEKDLRALILLTDL